MARPRTSKFDTEQSLLVKTRKLLEARLENEDEALVAICYETGFAYHWVRKLGLGQFKNPSVNRVQFLYEYLSGTKLIVE